MKQLLQNMRDGKTIVADVPIPTLRPGMVLIHTGASLVSAGTERMLVEFAEKNLLGKAQSRPDLVLQMLDKARREGILTTIEAAFNRLDQPMALGYSSAGTVVEVGEGVTHLHPGDRVACAGGNYAVHAEYAVVPKNLLVPIPPQVDFESAAFTTLGAIAMHGFRLAQPQLGEQVAVIGLGLLGLLTVGIAQAAGCTVFGVDLSPQRVELARKLGAFATTREDAEAAGKSFSQGRGFDVVLICADTRSNDPVALAGQLARDRGRVVAVGAVGLNIPRKIYYDKELQFQVSRSYGPGRYDPSYEEKGHDYPIGFVRWTEGRNLEAIVDLLASGKLDVSPLITHRFPLEKAPDAYELITGKTGEPFLGVVLTYPQNASMPASRKVTHTHSPKPETGALSLGVLGAGNYATAMFLPTVSRVGDVNRTGIASASGLTARHASQRYNFHYATSSEDEILNDPEINLIAVLTRHQHHARQVSAALKAGKHVFCEKPLGICSADLELIEEALYTADAPLLTVGFNRRFAPFAVRMKEFLSGSGEPLAIHYRVNAGYLPLNHWLHDPAQGGGRIIGEGCHFVDFLTYLTGSLPQTVQAVGLPDIGRYQQDNVSLTFTFTDGSVGTLSYLANGDKSFPKENVYAFSAGRVAVLDDFRSLELVQNGKRQVMHSRLRQDKGHQAAWQTFVNAVRQGGSAPIPYSELFAVTRATFSAVKALASHATESIV